MLAAQKDLARVNLRNLAVASADPDVSGLRRELYRIQSVAFDVAAGLDIDYRGRDPHRLLLTLNPDNEIGNTSRVSFKITVEPLNAMPDLAIDIVRLPSDKDTQSINPDNIEIVATLRSTLDIPDTLKVASIEVANEGEHSGVQIGGPLLFDVLGRMHLFFNPLTLAIHAAGSDTILAVLPSGLARTIYIRVVMTLNEGASVASPWIVLITTDAWPVHAAAGTGGAASASP